MSGQKFALAAASAALLSAYVAIAQEPAPATADADPGWYFSLGAGVNSLSDLDVEQVKENGSASANEFGLLGLIFPSAVEPIPLAGTIVGGVVIGVCGPLDVLCSPDPALGGLLGGGGGGGGPVADEISRFSASFKNGEAYALTVGHSYKSGLRPEFSFNYRSNDFESVTFGPGNGAVTGQTTEVVEGQTTSIAAMGNIWYDFNRKGRFQPYVGLGIGMNQVAFKEFSAVTTNVIADDKDMVFAYQIGAGLGVPLSDKLTASLDLRYIGSSEAEIKGTDEVSTFKFDYKASSALLGLRYFFGPGNEVDRDADGDGVPDSQDKCPNSPAGVPVGPDGCPLDTDGDGVPDYLDKCPNTPKGEPVGADGCPIDSDGDGVADIRDQCPDTPAGVQVDLRGCPLDSDGDGVPDYLDKCPNTPRGVKVDANGCPAEDSDGDGVPDYLDKCPQSAPGIPVGPDGCPLDSDGDGIPDYLDECPNSPAGAKVLPNGCALTGDCRRPRPGEQVDENGCAVDKGFILRGVKFEFDSDRLTEEAKLILNEVAETLAAYPNVDVELEGHTDNLGSDAYNLGLSERRSISVKAYLEGRGIVGTRMTPVGYGEAQPIDTNDTEEGRDNNRRVELTVREE